MIIINADDFGKSIDVNRAIDICMKRHIISSTSLMANMPEFDDAVKLAVRYGYIDKIGIHFNLSEGNPLTQGILYCKRFCNKENLFCYKRNSVTFLSIKEIKSLRNELKAQIKKIRDANIPISHFDSHHHVHTEFFIFLTLFDILKRNQISKVRISMNFENRSEGISGIIKVIYKRLFLILLHSLGFKTTVKMGHYSDLIKKLPFYCDTRIELMCHPIIIENKIIDACDKIDLKDHNLQIHSYNDL